MKHEAILNLYPSVVGVTDDNAYDKDGNLVSYDNTNVNKEILRLQAEWDAQEYARNRKAEYVALNQFELMTDDAANSTTTHADAIVVIKTKWPKNNTGPV